ncbi:MAG: M28 family metallopeptidase [Bdellovibrio sp.]
MKFHRKWILAVAAGMSLNAYAQGFWATIDKDVLETVEKNQLFAEKGIKSVGEHIAVVHLDERNLGHLSHIMHEDFKRCGGFVRHESLEEAMSVLDSENGMKSFEKMALVDYSIDQEEVVSGMLNQVDEINIRNTIIKLSSYQNRYYKSKTGEESQKYIFDTWSTLVQGRSDAKVEYYRHSGWGQPSVVLTLEGSSAETIIIGGHADSIAGWWGGAEARAPGADDNASGISTITEIIRILVANNYQPTKTLKFIAYAAEEVGLLGSKEIAQSYKQQNVDVVGVLQLDMTNFNGSKEDIVLMTDYTNEAQNKFVGSLVDKYLPGLSWGYDKCGYGCSDHASWHGQNFPASMPFESRKGAMNRNIHTARDTIDVSGSNASHAVKFAKLGVAFVVELDK